MSLGISKHRKVPRKAHKTRACRRCLRALKGKLKNCNTCRKKQKA